MGAFRRTLVAWTVAGLTSAAGCTTPEPFEAPAERLRGLPPAVPRGVGVPLPPAAHAGKSPVGNAVPPVDCADADAGASGYR